MKSTFTVAPHALPGRVQPFLITLNSSLCRRGIAACLWICSLKNDIYLLLYSIIIEGHTCEKLIHCHLKLKVEAP